MFFSICASFRLLEGLPTSTSACVAPTTVPYVWSKREDRTCCEAIGHDLLSATPILRLLKQGQDTDHNSVTFLTTMVKAAVDMSHDATGHWPFPHCLAPVNTDLFARAHLEQCLCMTISGITVAVYCAVLHSVQWV